MTGRVTIEWENGRVEHYATRGLTRQETVEEEVTNVPGRTVVTATTRVLLDFISVPEMEDQ